VVTVKFRGHQKAYASTININVRVISVFLISGLWFYPETKSTEKDRFDVLFCTEHMWHMWQVAV